MHIQNLFLSVFEWSQLEMVFLLFYTFLYFYVSILAKKMLVVQKHYKVA